MNGKLKIDNLNLDVKKALNKEKAVLLQRFFKTSKGEYGEGDIFCGLSVPECRVIAKKYQDLGLSSIEKLLYSKIHEERFIALVILTLQFVKGEESLKREICEFYLKHAKQVNSWDLVDLSAHKIVGAYLFEKDTKVLEKLAKSENLWERRIAIVSTYYFITQKNCFETIKITKILLKDEHDLIQKATGWMLREVGKNCGEDVLADFLRENYQEMPRVMLRYSIEKFPEELRKRYLRREIK